MAKLTKAETIMETKIIKAVEKAFMSSDKKTKEYVEIKTHSENKFVIIYAEELYGYHINRMRRLGFEFVSAYNNDIDNPSIMRISFYGGLK